ncbi:ArnT family glycosyltransferase [Phosphitispora sp. TUW77]|uniref:ArnT family glycosyltransferase n=1 Tax=Phosphitispora sp. TUW77 TaxID=3152361 RepID=UPI003AB357F4
MDRWNLPLRQPVSSSKKPISGKERSLILAILLITLVARLYYVYTSPQLQLSHDEIGYHEMTLQFLDKGFLGYYSDKPSAFVTPGYPIFLAVLYFVAQAVNIDPLTMVRTTQAIISVGSVFLVYIIARKSGGIPAGLLAAILSAVYLPAFMANNRILTEVLYVFLLLGYIYAVINAFEKNRLRWHALSGVMMGLAVLVRPSVAPFIVVPYIFIWFCQRRSWVSERNHRLIAGFLLALISFSLIMTPWWIRNLMVFDKFIVFATQSGNPLLRGTDPYDPYDKIGPSIIENIPESDMTRVAVERIKQGFKNEPVLWLKWFTAGKLSYMWSKPWGYFSGWPVAMHFWAFIILGWPATFINIFDSKMRWPALLIIFTTVLHLAFIPITRYMYPLTPLMAIMTAALIVKIAGKILDTDYLSS